MHLSSGQSREQCGSHCTGSTAQVDHDLAGPANGLAEGLSDEELGTAPGHEHTGLYRDPQAAELDPAEKVFQGLAGDPAVNHRGQLGGCPGSAHKQPGLVLGEDAACGTQPMNDVGQRERRRKGRRQ
ncbi:hypothetical protein FRAAL0527 [Frankia alni ACN14a]|uniref:Uncharacterized protein n=1 Tax=Frankia alni (strain DSM 45986 / CECT 9034 / ACN14a) TaxID=326424 RepID=Q0RT99_FRAAA|nr:hypothetical protein FRAAL0527 [Frankia alni ACN14a]